MTALTTLSYLIDMFMLEAESGTQVQQQNTVLLLCECLGGGGGRFKEKLEDEQQIVAVAQTLYEESWSFIRSLGVDCRFGS